MTATHATECESPIPEVPQEFSSFTVRYINIALQEAVTTGTPVAQNSMKVKILKFLAMQAKGQMMRLAFGLNWKIVMIIALGVATTTNNCDDGHPEAALLNIHCIITRTCTLLVVLLVMTQCPKRCV